MKEDLKKRIVDLMEIRGLTQSELSQRTGITQSSLSDYIKGKYRPKQDKIDLISKALGVSPAYLMGWDEEFNKDGKLAEDVEKIEKGVKIPVLGSIAAGIPIEAIEHFDSDEWEEIPEEMALHADYFALKIKGDSMEPKFSEDDVVIVKKQSDVESGEIAVVIVNGCDATVKKIIKEPNGIMLVANNAAVYPPKFYDQEAVINLPVRIIGKVVELRAKF